MHGCRRRDLIFVARIRRAQGFSLQDLFVVDKLERGPDTRLSVSERKDEVSMLGLKRSDNKELKTSGQQVEGTSTHKLRLNGLTGLVGLYGSTGLVGL